MLLPKPTDKYEEKAISDIQEHGLHIMHVFDPDGERPDFTYSIGMKYSYGHAEVIIYGLPNEVTKSIINSVADSVKSGATFKDGDVSAEFLEGFDCCFKSVLKEHYKDHFGWNLWLNNGSDFEVLQLVWPNKSGNYPWSDNVTHEFCNAQPLLIN